MNFELDIENILLEDCNSSFIKYFNIQNFSVVCEKTHLSDLDNLFVKEFVPVKEMSFNVELDEKSNVFNSDFRKEFGIHNFEVYLNENSSINNFLFEDHFDINQSFDYSIIENLKKDFNSRKILTREEREQIPELEPEIFSIEQDKKKTVSIEENLEKSKSVIKENSFYKIVEFDVSEPIIQVPTEIDNSYKEEVDQKIIDLENKYEDLLQKTKNEYETRIGKMIDDFSEFRNHINQQVNRMTFISSATGGGAVNILDMDDVDKTNLQNGYTLSYNNSLKKFEFINGSSATFDRMQADVFEVEQINLDKNYIDISAPADSNYYELSEFHVNGVVNIYQTNYTFLSSTRIDISNLSLSEGDKVRIFYIKS